jgi:hypothetical protein
METSHDQTKLEHLIKSKIELANFGDITIGRATLQPGWSWLNR